MPLGVKLLTQAVAMLFAGLVAGLLLCGALDWTCAGWLQRHRRVSRALAYLLGGVQVLLFFLPAANAIVLGPSVIQIMERLT